jgi:hypothetical protein
VVVGLVRVLFVPFGGGVRVVFGGVVFSPTAVTKRGGDIVGDNGFGVTHGIATVSFSRFRVPNARGVRRTWIAPGVLFISVFRRFRDNSKLARLCCECNSRAECFSRLFTVLQFT